MSPETEKSKAETILDESIQALIDLDDFTDICADGLNLQGDPHLAPAMATLSRFFGGPSSEDLPGQKKTNTERRLKFATRERTEGFPYLYELSTIRLWTQLETTVDDLVFQMIRDFDQTKQMPTLSKLQGPLISFAAASADAQAEQLMELLTRELAPRLKTGCGRFESLLNAVGLGGPLSTAVKSVLLELGAVRNVLVHKRGRCDSRLLKQCPWLLEQPGERIRISPARYDGYGISVIWYLYELRRRVEIVQHGQAGLESIRTVEAIGDWLDTKHAQRVV